jgi:NAD(P)-dependent dehydrogenase (short-subunit alcohol dehydrogenase family)
MLNPMNLSGRTILLTGASSGIGRETAVCLSQLGARLVLVGRNQERLQSVAERLEGLDHHLEIFELREIDKISDWMKQVTQKVGPFDGLVHSAGVPAMIPLRYLTAEQLQDTLAINLNAALFLTKAFRMRGNHQPKSSIVFLSSSAGLTGEPGVSAYSATKGALIAMARSLAVELVREGIRVNCVAPGFVKSELLEKYSERVSPEQLAATEATFPLGFGEPLDVAYSIAFLLAETGRWITGTTLVVDGGYTAT